MPTATAALELRYVTASYSTPRTNAPHGARGVEPPVSRVNFAIHEGEFVTVLGPNGAGKSTLLRVLAGVVPPVEGEVVLFGRAMGEMAREEIARNVAVVPQTHETPQGFTVRQIVLMGRAPYQGRLMIPSKQDNAVVDDAMRRCDVLEHAQRFLHELSAGEQKRVFIAKGLAQTPKILLLDEPGAFLDVCHQIELYDLLTDEVRRQKLACVVVMHDINIASQYASRIVLMKRGRVTAAGAVGEIMSYERLREVFDADFYSCVTEGTRTQFFLPRGKVL